MTRLEWQQFAERWLVDAKRLLDEKRWSAAYYVAGYAVECALKACILAHVAARPEVIFEERRFSERCWTHDFADLVELADLETTRAAEMATNRALSNNWFIVRAWTEKSRYQTTTYQKARQFYAAISDRRNGVMTWIRAHW